MKLRIILELESIGEIKRFKILREENRDNPFSIHALLEYADKYAIPYTVVKITPWGIIIAEFKRGEEKLASEYYELRDYGEYLEKIEDAKVLELVGDRRLKIDFENVFKFKYRLKP